MGTEGDAGQEVLLAARHAPPSPLRPLGQAWTSHRAMATVLVVLATALPTALALAVTALLAQDWTRPSGPTGLIGYWSVLAVVAFVIISAAHVVTRRLLPLAALLRMGLAFPGAAPSRFRLALHAGSTRRLARGLHPGDDGTLGDAGAASLMLELVTDLSDHDRATRGHSERVRAYTELLAAELGVSADDRQRLRWAGLLHDIGKLETPSEILNKPSALTADEFATIRRHPLDGHRLAMPLWDWLGDFVLGVSDHHERWEGGGYPSGAAGTEISLAGRIVAVADAFDVMTSSRSYKAPVSAEEARAELARCSGAQFDPEVVRAFLGIELRSLRRVIGVLALVSPIPTLFRRASALSVPARSAIGAAGVATTITVWAIVAPSLPLVGDSAELGAGQPAAPAGEVIAPTTAPVPLEDTPATDPDPDRTEVLGDEAQAPTTGRDRMPGTVDLPTPGGPGGGPGSGPGDGPGRSNPPGGPATPPGPRPGPDRPSPSDPPPPDPANEPLGVVIDPEAGSVAVDGLSTEGPIDLVEVQAVGAIACGGAGVCDPIVIDLPVTLPPLF